MGREDQLTMAFVRDLVGCTLALGSLVALNACASLTAPQPGNVIEVADIINSVKCGLAEALNSDAGRRRLKDTIANVELQLKIVDTRGFNASTPSGNAPRIFAWFGPTAIPLLSASNEESFAVDTTIDLTYRLDSANGSVCDAAGVDRQDRFGFARWLGDIISGLSKVSLQGPKGSLDKLTYDATFAVTRSGSAGGSVKVVFLSAGANVNRNRADTQHLKIVITGPNSVATTVDASGTTRTVPTKQVGPIPNLSASPPAQR